MEEEPRRIIVARTDRIGDVVLSLPVFASLKKCFPKSEVIALVREDTADVAASFHAVDRSIIYDPEESLGSTAKKLREADADAILTLFPRFPIAASAVAAGIPVRVGTAYRWYSFLFNRRVHEHRKDSVKSEAEYNLSLAEAIGCHKKIMDITLEPDAGAAERVKLFLKENVQDRYIVVHPGSGGSARAWPETRFRILLETISRDLDIIVLVTGSQAERGLCERVSTGIRGVVNVAGQFYLKEFMALLKDAEVFVSNSTGPIHLSAAVGTPVVGIYPNNKPMTPKRWAPITERKLILTPKDGSDEVDRISSEEVMRSILELTSVKAK